MPFLLCLLVGLGLQTGTQPARAQTRDRGPIILQLPASTRALALGNAFALGFRDPDALFYQPGDLVNAQGISGSIQRYGAASTLSGASAARSWLSGGVALGLRHLSYGAQATPPVLGEDILNLSQDVGSLRDNGPVGASETVLYLGYARSVAGVRMGAVGKMVDERIGGRKSTVAALDLGVALAPGPLTLGLAIQNLAPDMKIGGARIPLPRRVSLGASTDMAWVGPLDISASGVIAYQDGEGVFPSLGMEVAYWPVTGRTFIVRFGLRGHPEEQSGSAFTFGGGFEGDDLVLDYAYEGFVSGDPSHRITLGWR